MGGACSCWHTNYTMRTLLQMGIVRISICENFVTLLLWSIFVNSTQVKKPASLRGQSDQIRCEREENQGRQSRHSPILRRAISFALTACFAGGVWGAETAKEEPVELDPIKVQGAGRDTNPYAQEGSPYKARVSGDNRHLKDLADTPKNITVLTQTQLQESGRSDLRDILAAQPGITLGTGENGNAFGDRYIIRGHEARSDVFVDGLRDPGMTTRESFATEQIEITKGPSSTFAGRGSTGGAINGISKQASLAYDFNKSNIAAGTDDYRRITWDTNHKISDTAAVRVNLLHAFEEVPDRAPADRERNGLALSGIWQASPTLDFVADVYYLDAQDTPDLGTYVVPGGGEPVADIPVYLQENADFLDSDVRTFTLRTRFDPNDRFRLENVTRYGTTDNGYVATGARGSTRSDDDPLAPGAPTITLSTHQGWQEVDYFANQLNAYTDVAAGGLTHQLVASVEYSNIDVLNGVFNVNNTGATNCVVSARGGTRPGHCLIGPDGGVVDNATTLLGREITRSNSDSDYQVDTWSVALMDTVDFNERWSGFFGVRVDSFDYDNTVTGRDRTTGETIVTPYSYSDDLWNGHAGIVYNVNRTGNIYLTWSTSSNINGGESDLGGNCGYGGLCGDPLQVQDSEPEQTTSFELGTKWNLMGDRLLATATAFQVTKDDVMESVGDDYETLGTLNTGKNRVEGVELSLVGKITDRLSAQMGAAFMEAEVLESFNEETVGLTLSNFAEDSIFMQLRYEATPRFTFGGTLTWSSELLPANQTQPPDTTLMRDATTTRFPDTR